MQQDSNTDELFVLPASFAQERLWILHQLDPESSAYNLAAAVRLRGRLDQALVERAVFEIVRRHEALRTHFAQVDRELVQLVRPEAPVSLRSLDLGELEGRVREEELRRLCEQEARRPFDLGKGPLLRVALIRLKDREHVLLWVVHHAVFDGWSTYLVLSEFAALYSAYARGLSSPLPELALQYADFAHWQRERLSGTKLEAELSYWKTELADMEGVLSFPPDRPRKPIQQQRGARYPVRIDGTLARAIDALAAGQGCTAYAVLACTFKILLARYSGCNDVRIATPVTNRERAELEPLVGCFANTLVLRSDLSGDPTFCEALARVHRTLCGAQQHREVPFEQVIDALQVARDLSHAPLCQVMFALAPRPRATPELPDLTLDVLDLDAGGAQFDVALELVPTADGLDGAIEYDTDLYDAASIARLARHFTHLLRRAVERPHARLSELPFREEQECAALLAWCRGSAERAPALDVRAQIERVADGNPSVPALVHGTRSLRYGELERRANQLARLLWRKGVRAGDRVGICLVRSIPQIVAMLGTWKAGAAYVPLDPGLPRERLREVAADAALRAVIAESESVIFETAAAWIALDASFRSISDERIDPFVRSMSPSETAYVIYTSGSTGTPKGVLVSHAALASFVASAAAFYEIEPTDRVLQFAATSFDASVEEIFPCLARGACLVLRSEEMLESAETFFAACARWSISVLDLPTSYFHRLMNARSAGELPASLRLLIIGGEAAQREPVRRFQRWSGGRVRLVNTYGPTEATVVATAADLEHGDDERPVSIGRPLAHVQAYVLDAQLSPQPVGALGELFLGGAGLSDGYLGRPRLTAERFVPSPFERGERLYRTGDRARFRPDGQLEFVGRLDAQIKLRGFRIELGEVEARLVDCAEVREAVVVARKLGNEPQLVAYVETATELSGDALRRKLAATLPDHMVPAAVVVLPALPRTAQGKLDRRHLPEPELRLAHARTAPRDEREQKLAQVWGELLGQHEIFVEDNFFALGGDSILALQVVARARELGLVLSPRQLFQYQTIEALSAVVTEARGASAALRPEGAAPLSPMQRWLFEQADPEPHQFNQSVLLALRERVDAKELEQALHAVAAHHDAFRLRFERGPDGWEQRYGAAARADFICEVLAGGANADERMTARAEHHQASLHLTEGPLLLVVLFDVEPAAPQRLLVIAHHAVMDGVSFRFLLEDLQTAYRQIRAGHTVTLPFKGDSFGAWSRALSARADGEEVLAQRVRWREALSDLRPLPVDDPAGSELEGATRQWRRQLTAAETQRLQRAAAHYHLRLDELLVAGLASMLGTLCARDCVHLELEGHGRAALEQLGDPGEIDVSRTIGWFTSVYPVALQVPRAGSLEQLLKSSKEELRAAASRAASYGVLRYLADTRDSEALCTLGSPDVCFNYLGSMEGLLAPDALFGSASAGLGAERGAQLRRAYALEVDAAIVAQRLQFTFSFSGARHRLETIVTLAELLLARLQELAAYIESAQESVHTPSDFPLAGVTQIQLDRLIGAARDVEDVYPLSPLQQGILFHSLWGGSTGDYVEQVTCELEGELDVSAFRSAWERVIARHPALRTTFCWEAADVPLQRVRRAGELELSFARAPRGTLQELLQRDRARGFDLREGPLFRLQLLALGPSRHRLVFTHHHLILDGWSAARVLDEVVTLYESSTRGGPEALPAAPSYRDYIAWLMAHSHADAAAFWREKLGGFEAATALPYARATPQQGPLSLCVEALSLGAPATRRLEAFAREQRITLSTLVQAAWAFVLARSAGTEDVLFGVTVAGRGAPLAGIERGIGLYINSLPLRLRVAREARVIDWLREVFAAAAELGPHEHSALADVRNHSAVPAGQPLFESLLVVENYPFDERLSRVAGGLSVCDLSYADQTNYPLTLTVTPGAELALRIQYDARRFEGAAGARVLRLVASTLEQWLGAPEARLGELGLLSRNGAEDLLSGWSRPATTFEGPSDVLAWIEARAAARPDDVALVFERQTLSYRELNARANQVARALRRLGAGPDVLVAVALERSVELVVALLAVMKAGAAYVPIDPDYPADRIAYMLADSRALVLLSVWPVAARLPAHSASLFCLDLARGELAREESGDLGLRFAPDQLAYCIYTSGSTGTPKGAGNTQRGLLNRLAWMQQHYGLTTADCVLQKTPFSFDVSVWEFFWPLMVGATLVVARAGDHRDSARLLELIARHEVTTLHFVPPMLEAFLETADRESCRSLKRILCSGDALSAELARRCLERLDAELHNLYGPTEASIDVSAWQCTPSDHPSGVPIGLPIANTQLYVLDRAGQLLPPGLAGELHIGGVGLARGYHLRPALTAERFVPDPFGTPGGRLYRTGDLVRQRDDGTLEFLGRLDHQVKIRGLRVELGEIEARLATHPAVREAVVVAREQAHGGKRLLGYVSGTELPEETALRGWVAEALPTYMVPARILLLERLPLSPNGKIDRRALPPPEQDASRAATYVPPRTEVERALCEIWASVLHLEQVGVDDDFFALGGDSIVTLQVVARAAQQGFVLTPKQLFEHPTIARLAPLLPPREGAAQATGPAPTSGAGTEPNLSGAELEDLINELAGEP